MTLDNTAGWGDPRRHSTYNLTTIDLRIDMCVDMHIADILADLCHRESAACVFIDGVERNRQQCAILHFEQIPAHAYVCVRACVRACTDAQTQAFGAVGMGIAQ